MEVFAKTKNPKEGSTINRFSSIFSQLLQLMEFHRLVKETQAERHARGFTC